MPANIPGELAALPMEALIGGPLTAAIKAQALAAQTTVDFIRQVGLMPSAQGSTELKATTVEFLFDRVVEQTTNGTTNYNIVPSKLGVPLLSIVPIPFIRIQDMTIDFEYEIKDVDFSENETNVGVQLDASANWGWGKASLKGSFSHRSTNRRQTDRRANMKVTVNAVQDEIPEGLSRVLDMLHESIKVVPQSSTNTNPTP